MHTCTLACYTLYVDGMQPSYRVCTKVAQSIMTWLSDDCTYANISKVWTCICNTVCKTLQLDKSQNDV